MQKYQQQKISFSDNISEKNFILETKALCVSYDTFKVLNHVNIVAKEGKICALIGPNGSGKSTTLKAIFGLLAEFGGVINSGSIFFEGNEITHIRTDQLIQRGISLVPEGRHVFSNMTVFENLKMGGYILKSKVISSNILAEILDLFPILKSRLRQNAGTLSTGEQQMLAIGRALMSRPKMLIADEPTIGLSPRLVDIVLDKLISINRQGISLMLVEQKAFRALEIAHNGYIFKLGKIEAFGKAQTLRNHPLLREVYFSNKQ